MARTARATGVGEAILLRVLDLQRGAFSASLQSRSSRPGWVLPNWPELVRSLRPACRALRSQIVDILGLERHCSLRVTAAVLLRLATR